MKKMINKIFALSLSLILILTATLPVNGQTSPELTVILKCGEDYISDAVFKIYLVAKKDENSRYVLTDEFKNSQWDLNSLSQENSREYAKNLSAFVKSKNIPSIREISTNKEGIALFENLKEGIYLVLGDGFDKGEISPFLAEIPVWDENGKLIYSVTAMPKTKLTTPDERTTRETATEKETEAPREEKKSEEKLPLTGQLLWPVFLLLSAGLLLIIFGIICRRSEENEAKE